MYDKTGNLVDRSLGVATPRHKRATILTFLASSAVCGLVGYLQGANSICGLLGAGLVPAVLSLVFVAFASIGTGFRTIATRYRIVLYTSLFVLIGESLIVIENGVSAV